MKLALADTCPLSIDNMSSLQDFPPFQMIQFDMLLPKIGIFAVKSWLAPTFLAGTHGCPSPKYRIS